MAKTTTKTATTQTDNGVQGKYERSAATAWFEDTFIPALMMLREIFDDMPRDAIDRTGYRATITLLRGGVTAALRRYERTQRLRTARPTAVVVAEAMERKRRMLRELAPDTYGPDGPLPRPDGVV